jgi:DNA-binding response OmpR family regulator
MTGVPEGRRVSINFAETQMSPGKTALVIEAEFLIALDLQRMLEAHGFAETLLARHAAEALELSGSWQRLSLAVVEIRLHDQPSFDLLTALQEHQVPTVAITSDVELTHGIDGFATIPVLGKPLSEDQLASAIHRTLGALA